MICYAVILAAATHFGAAALVKTMDPTTPVDAAAARSERCLHGPFVNITQTTDLGEIIGPVDPNDWGCLGDRSPHRPGGRQTIGLEDVPVPPPTHLCFNEASPNPATSATRLGMSLPEDTHVSVAIYAEAEHGRGRDAVLIRTLADGDFRAGLFTIVWDLKDDHGTRVHPGIYRAVLTAPGGVLCGDIQVQ